MSLSNTTVKQKYNANGATTQFAIPFAHIASDSTETKVYLVNESVDPVTETLQTEGALQDYTLTGASPPGTPFDTHVTFNSAPASTYKVLIVRVLALTQPEDLDAVSTVELDTIETAIDRVVAQVQELSEKVDRAPKYRLSNTTDTNPLLPDPSAGQYLRWNSAEDGLENVTAVLSSNNGTLSVPASSTDNGIPRWDGTAGDTVQDSGVTIDDSDNLTTAANVISKNNFSGESSVAIANSQTNANVTGMTVAGASITSAAYLIEVVRSTTIMNVMWLYLYYINSTWTLIEGPRYGTGDDGITFDVSQTGANGQVRYTSDASGTGTFKFKRVVFNV